MSPRALAGSLLVLLAAVAVLEISADMATRHASLRHRWEASAAEQAAVSLSHRTLAAVVDWSVVDIGNAVEPAVVPGHCERPTAPSGRIFVPPRL
jgi:hypothetical protein